MCGIVGYIGPKSAVPILIGGLEKLEYRGYDSAGIATIRQGKIEVERSVGKLANLKNRLQEQLSGAGTPSHIGIGHTRWATHGRPSETNAHPHIAGNVCVVHNGIIENYVALREELEGEGCKFASETDTEIAAHLINKFVKQGSSLIESLRSATARMQGSYALVVLSVDDPERIVVARNSTPVILGLGEGENFVASDIPAVLEHTRRIQILEDGELAEITAQAVRIERDGIEVKREPTVVTWDAITAEKGGYRHFMLKEIHEQPQVITDTFRGRVNPEAGEVFLDGVELLADQVKRLRRVIICGCGTAWHAGLISKYYIERLAGIPVEVDYSSEFRYRPSLLGHDDLFIVISQSGETADSLGALQIADGAGATTLAICNVVGSTIARKAKHVLYTHAGPEISVASTKAFVTQLTAAFLLALDLGVKRGNLSAVQVREHLQALINLPHQVSEALKLNRQIEKVARKYGNFHDFLFLGRGILYPIALEGALKLKEISYLHAEGYPAGEMKHGPIALINEETPVVMVMGHDGINYDKCLSNLREVESRGGRIIVVADSIDAELKELAWEGLSIGESNPLLLPILSTVPLQLLAYHVAIYRGTDVDQPRNLAKSVTVE